MHLLICICVSFSGPCVYSHAYVCDGTVIHVPPCMYMVGLWSHVCVWGFYWYYSVDGQREGLKCLISKIFGLNVV